MTNQEIYELMARFDSSTVQTLRLTRGDFSLELTRGGASAASEPAAVPAASAAALVLYSIPDRLKHLCRILFVQQLLTNILAFSYIVPHFCQKVQRKPVKIF